MTILWHTEQCISQVHTVLKTQKTNVKVNIKPNPYPQIDKMLSKQVRLWGGGHKLTLTAHLSQSSIKADSHALMLRGRN